MYKYVVGAFFWFLFSVVLLANESDSLFNEANSAFKEGDFGKAAALYEQLIDGEYTVPEVHYNLGNAYYRLNKPGKAILHYEKAALLSPGDKDIKHNLYVVRQQLQDDFEAIPGFFLLRWWRNLRQQAGSGTWAVLTILFIWVGLGGFSWWLLDRIRLRKKAGFIIAVVSLSLGLLLLSLAIGQASFEKNSGFAIVLQPTVSLRSAPDEAGTEILQIHEGTKVELLDQLGTWKKVCLPNGEQGWLPQDVVEQI